MKIKMNQAIVGLNGKQIELLEKKLNLGDVCAEALVNNHPDEKGVAGKEKLERFELAIKVYKGKDVELTSEEITLIKKLVAFSYAPLVCGQVWKMIDPKSSDHKD